MTAAEVVESEMMREDMEYLDEMIRLGIAGPADSADIKPIGLSAEDLIKRETMLRDFLDAYTRTHELRYRGEL